MSSDNDERFWNFVIYRAWMTDQELEEFMPVFAGLIGILMLVAGCVALGWWLWILFSPLVG